jgi:hypothetical protein
VALDTLQSGMFAVKFKPGIVVVKPFGCPVIKSVAPFAVVLAVFHKLSGMHILVAVFTIHPQATEPLIDRTVSFSIMAIPARNCLMPSKEAEICLVMTETDCFPRFFAMAGRAVSLCKIFLLNFVSMGIIVTIDAPFT